MPPVRRSRGLFDEGPGWGFRLWFALCAVLGIGLIGVIVWLLIAIGHWIERH